MGDGVVACLLLAFVPRRLRDYLWFATLHDTPYDSLTLWFNDVACWSRAAFRYIAGTFPARDALFNPPVSIHTLLRPLAVGVGVRPPLLEQDRVCFPVHKRLV